MPKIPALSESQRHEIAETLRFWASVHPYPDQPMIDFPFGTSVPLTPRSIADAAAHPDTPEGQRLYKKFAIALMDDGVEAPETLDEILADFRRDAKWWAAGNRRTEKPRPPSF